MRGLGQPIDFEHMARGMDDVFDRIKQSVDHTPLQAVRRLRDSLWRPTVTGGMTGLLRGEIGREAW